MKITIGIILLLSLITISSSKALAVSVQTNNLQPNAVMDGYKILSLFSHNIVSGFRNVLPAQMSPFGVTTDSVAPVIPIEDSDGITISNIDYLCSEINVSDYDILWLPGEMGTDNLTLYTDAYDLIIDAYNEGLVMVAYNYGPIAFASTNIISGKNISGHSGIQSAVESAGGTYIASGVIVDSPFITTTWQDPSADLLYYYVGLELGFDLLATETPTPTTTPTDVSGLPFASIVFIACAIFGSMFLRKKQR